MCACAFANPALACGVAACGGTLCGMFLFAKAALACGIGFLWGYSVRHLSLRSDQVGVLCAALFCLLKQPWPVGLDPVGLLCDERACEMVSLGVGIFNPGCAAP